MNKPLPTLSRHLNPHRFSLRARRASWSEKSTVHLSGSSPSLWRRLLLPRQSPLILATLDGSAIENERPTPVAVAADSDWLGGDENKVRNMEMVI
ncbi:hypothetical protein FOZ60_003397 [Perkinsus olseni]|uniref:Uncharacterized protein n=1 Tax=Perkinsus olseni TaxID=32597 RepID=A0A7J6PJZ1_PEROL|nr:hypothetical protein FOZ60_003397 [Perkinsus olseni]